MVLQSTDFAARLHIHRETLSDSDCVTYDGIHMDAWWPRSEAAKKERLGPTAIVACRSPPLTILAVDAPVMRQVVTYSRQSLSYLVKKVLLIFGVAAHRRSPLILSGLLGGGAFRNNRPLVLLLHLLLQPENLASTLRFHHPVFDSFSGLSTDTLERRTVQQADEMVEQLRNAGVRTLGQAVDAILSWQLATSHRDADLQADTFAGKGQDSGSVTEPEEGGVSRGTVE